MAALTTSPPGSASAHAPAGLADYLARHRGSGRPFATVTAAERDRVPTAVFTAITPRQDEQLVWLAAPLPTGRALLVAVLAEIGLAPPPAGLDELHNLLLVYLKHESRRGRRLLVVLAAADRCGPCVFDLLQTLARIPGSTPGTAALTIVLCGGPGLHRVLDSAGMAGARPALRERYDLDRQKPWLAQAPLFITTPATGSPAVAGGKPVLDVLLDGTIQRRIPLLPGRNVVGRDRGNAIHLASRYVSRRHAVILCAGAVDQLLDLRSRNGTQVNGRPVSEHRLVDGDLVAVGNYRLRYRLHR